MRRDPGPKAGSSPNLLPYPQRVDCRKAVLKDIRPGKFVQGFKPKNAVGQPFFKATRRLNDTHPVEQASQKLRALMPWISKGKMVDRARN